ncbi:putative BRCA1 C Terminus (BRCT) domain [Lyophyllum shimeji]|uniref:BRCA1 C Terminus (BRCT) domain n=1 Tax=Lyophyllum shimeji TaxID=47721 RepID=A0A9P3UNF2_LYOSH|nr:putative BRCA1 C Terminus (BRCT) domain [Lyophyllum shimeji]
MASSIFTEKRTRSQLTLPDELLFQLSQRSPLKDARIALRTNNNNQAGSSAEKRVQSTEESDDELLLSPGKVAPGTRTSKRSVSPPPGDEYAARSDFSSNGRELKRLKREGDGTPTTNGGGDSKNPIAFAPRSTHTRTLSQPQTGKKSSRNRSGTLSPSKPDYNASAQSAKGRAQSVPLFPSSSSSSILHIDLRNPPPSPRRLRSRSPSKEPELRIVPEPATVMKVDTIPEEADLGMNVNEDTVESSKPSTSPQTAASDPPDMPDTKTLTNDTMVRPTTPERPANTPSIEESSIPMVNEPPATPLAQRPVMSPLSPLTPLPETPHPSKFATSTQNRYTGAGWGVDPQEADEDKISSLALASSKPLLGLGITKKSRLPRSSSSLNLPSSAMGPPSTRSIPAAQGAMQMGPPLGVPTAKKALMSSISESRTTAPTQANNAFAVMMAKARENSEKGKGKGKDIAMPTKVGSSSKGATKAASGSEVTQKGKAGDKRKGREAPPPKMSIKSQMKPRQQAKPKAGPFPVSLPQTSLDSEAEAEDESPRSPSRATSPANSPPPSRPSSPPMMDVSMESIDPPAMVKDKPPDEPENLPRATSASQDPSETSALLKTVPEDPQVLEAQQLSSPSPPVPVKSRDADVVDMPNEPAVEDPVGPPGPERIATDAAAAVATPAEPSLTEALLTVPPPTEPGTELAATETTATQSATQKPAKTKLHISKRVPTAVAPADRVTRSASLRRNKQMPEVPQPAARKTSGKQALARKKSLTAIESSGPSSSGKAADHAPQEDASNPSDLPTDPAEPILPPGSPMKLGSPAKPTKDSSFAPPPQSPTGKTGLSKSPVKPRLAKSRTPSPSKLSRSASMFSSRATGTLSRTFTFTGYGNTAGSSLSTLSSALEKLHQPPPARPNTSMGFNRDDADSSFELKATSKDDASIGSSGSAGTSNGAASSSQAAAGGSRLVQRTLISGPRSSLTGKSIFGTGTTMRGMGGFKVCGNSTKPAARRMFGVGGVFSGASKARTIQKASRKTSLPSVMASPVKGGDTGDAMDVADDGDEDKEPVPAASTTIPTNASADQEVPLIDKGKGKERSTDAWRSNASRRASLASQALSQSLSALPPKATPAPGSMAPPATPTRKATRSASSTYPSAKASTSSGGEASEQRSPPTGSMTMNLRNASSATNGGAGGSKIATATTAAKSHVPEALKILKDCVIYVDVRTDDGDEAGSLFVEMLEGVGARILTRVGQTCTHIVFKNSLMSTITRYRLLRDPKPLVVGIAWVVECIEQMKQVDETKFLVDLDGMNVSGTNKRRRSMLPKLIARESEEKASSDAEGDVSMDGSTSCKLARPSPPLRPKLNAARYSYYGR